MAVLFSIVEATEQLGGISPWTLRKHIAQGRVRVTRIGRRIFMDVEELGRIRREGLPSLKDTAKSGLPDSDVNLTDGRTEPCR